MTFQRPARNQFKIMKLKNDVLLEHVFHRVYFIKDQRVVMETNADYAIVVIEMLRRQTP